MDSLYRYIIRPVLFLLPPEVIHDIMMVVLKIPLISYFLGRLFHAGKYNDPVQLCGLTFPNVVGLAAGFDKDAEVPDAWHYLGFGCVEIGTVTPLAQPGNPKPRLFRLVRDGAIINRMGFNNNGAAEIRKNLSRKRTQVIIGGNIGKNKATPNEEAVRDYEICFRELYGVVDYFAVNVSSPNTPHLRELQEKEPLQDLLTHLMKLNYEMPSPKPIFLKIAPDLTDQQLDDIIGIVQYTGISGVIATNTTITREGLTTDRTKIGQIGDGGLSGKPLSRRSTEVIRYIHDKSEGKFPIIGVGGIFSEEDALEKLEAGASLVQIYTGFIYEGPGLIRRIKNRLTERHFGQN